MPLHLPAWMLAVAEKDTFVPPSKPRALRYAGNSRQDLVPGEVGGAKPGYLYLLYGKPGE